MEVQFKKCYRYKGKTIFTHVRVVSEETGKSFIVWSDIYDEDQTLKFTPEEAFIKEETLKLVEKKS